MMTATFTTPEIGGSGPTGRRALDIVEAFLPRRPPSHSPPQDRAKRESRERQSKPTQGEPALTMAPLRNQKHEKYALALFEGKPQNQAYVDAGYRYHEGNASRLRRNEQVIARLAELQAQRQPTPR